MVDADEEDIADRFFTSFLLFPLSGALWRKKSKRNDIMGEWVQYIMRTDMHAYKSVQLCFLP
jgi:hypothetical protein